MERMFPIPSSCPLQSSVPFEGWEVLLTKWVGLQGLLWEGEITPKLCVILCNSHPLLPHHTLFRKGPLILWKGFSGINAAEACGEGQETYSMHFKNLLKFSHSSIISEYLPVPCIAVHTSHTLGLCLFGCCEVRLPHS